IRSDMSEAHGGLLERRAEALLALPESHLGLLALRDVDKGAHASSHGTALIEQWNRRAEEMKFLPIGTHEFQFHVPHRDSLSGRNPNGKLLHRNLAAVAV